MTIRDKGQENDDQHAARLRRKMNQQWDLAGLARRDLDEKACADHTAAARQYSKELAEYLREIG